VRAQYAQRNRVLIGASLRKFIFLLLRYVLVTDTLITPSQLQSGKARARFHNSHFFLIQKWPQ
jgi:hypothetical protein